MSRAVGRQLTRVILLCALSLAVGLGLGLYAARLEQTIQQELVAQMLREVRGLTGDMQRVERALSTLDTEHRAEIASQRAVIQQQLSTVELELRRQVQGIEFAEASCLAEFEAYRRKHLTVPVEVIDRAVGRLARRQAAELSALVDDVGARVHRERTRLAESISDRRVSQGLRLPGVETTPPPVLRRGDEPGDPAPLLTALPQGAMDSAISSAAIAERPVAKSPGTAETWSPEEVLEGDEQVVRQSPEPPAVPVTTEPELACIPMPGAPELVPVPERTLPAFPQAASAGAPPSRSILSFASGRTVETQPPAPRRTLADRFAELPSEGAVTAAESSTVVH